MSAICGVFNRDGAPLDSSMLTRLMNGLSEFGHDGSAMWEGQEAAFGIQKLHVTPESKIDRQPRWDEDRGLAIVADARIDNRAELSGPLGLAESAPDSDFVLEAFHKWETECPRQLLGDFAFAIWDANRKRLFCARDFLGLRPFYFHESEARFLFASDSEGLLRAGVSAEPDFPFLAAHFRGYCNFPHRSRTCHAAIRALPPASAMTVDANGIKQWEFWTADGLPEIRFKDQNDYVEAAREQLLRAVSDRLRCDGLVAAHFSGGLDSTTVAVLAQRELKQSGRELAAGFSWSPPGEAESPEDERRRIRELAARDGIPVRFAESTARDQFEYRFFRHDLKYTSDEPEEWAIRRDAAASGVRLILSGWGGDEGVSFHGHGYLANQFRTGSWLSLWRTFREGRREERISYRGLFRECLEPITPAWLLRVLGSGRLLPAGFWPSKEKSCLRPEFAELLRAADPLPHRFRRFGPDVRRNQRMLLRSLHLTRRAEAWAAAGGRLGLNYAFPLLDRRLIEFCLGLPPECFFNAGQGRILLRRAAEAWLPGEFCWSPAKSEPALRESRANLPRPWVEDQLGAISDLLESAPDLKCVDLERARFWLSLSPEDRLARSGMAPIRALTVESALNSEFRAS